MRMENSNWRDWIWDFCCAISIFGIWPRFIEPRLLLTTRLSLPIRGLPPALEELKIAHFSDLHLNPRVPSSFLDKLVLKIDQFQPDLLVFTGDFLCYSNLSDPSRLKAFLNRFKAPLGCYAVLGNHDYQSRVSLNREGVYDLVAPPTCLIQHGLGQLFFSSKPKKKVTDRARLVPPHSELMSLLKNSPFELLDNCSKLIQVNGTYLNLTGLGEHTLGRCRPDQAFKDYVPRYPGLILAHNPDAVPHLLEYPGNIILSGHTHGAQINLPFIWKRFELMENPQYKRGLLRVQDKWVYVNRGIGSIVPFRWFSPPEVLFITLKSHIETG